ncbi:hypothetical protein O3P69_018458 [Scylla paramamosain]|uniref:Uncharacterized protein n=1 Tax=Scylla paramamosain TaxID=85552 RepID=A0AAW0T225_SCYPA
MYCTSPSTASDGLTITYCPVTVSKSCSTLYRSNWLSAAPVVLAARPVSAGITRTAYYHHHKKPCTPHHSPAEVTVLLFQVMHVWRRRGEGLGGQAVSRLPGIVTNPGPSPV